MSFWANVDIELKFQSISRKELSHMVGVKEITIHKAIERDSVPSADTAVRIAKALNVSLEYLLDMEENGGTAPTKESADAHQATKLYRKYNTILNQLENLSPKERTAVTQLVSTLAK